MLLEGEIEGDSDEDGDVLLLGETDRDSENDGLALELGLIEGEVLLLGDALLDGETEPLGETLGLTDEDGEPGIASPPPKLSSFAPPVVCMPIAPPEA